MKLTKKYILLGLPFIVGAIFMITTISTYGVNTPFSDQWELVPLLQKVDTGTLSIKDLWRQHNEHRVLFPNMVLILSASLTHWNIKTEMYISWAFTLIIALGLYLYILKRDDDLTTSLIFTGFIAGILFSPVQWENWIWGWQVEWYMCIAMVVATFYLLSKFVTKNHVALFIGGVIAAFVATYSLGSGILVWPIGLGILLLQHKKITKWAIVWSAAAVATFGSCFYESVRL